MATRKTVRTGGKRLKVANSGLEVWLYDEGRREAIRASGAMGFMGRPGVVTNYREVALAGDVVGYSLMQDDEVDVEVHVGKPLTEKELSVAAWLEPQRALLRLPTGKLCVESNDACRIGPDEPQEKGATTEVPPGDYRLTLYRVDHEALKREERAWSGAREIIVLTPGGTKADAADDLLPYAERVDLSWVGQYRVDGSRADVLVWFEDQWDTFTINLDSAAAKALLLAPGDYLRTSVPDAKLTLTTAYAASWDDAARFPPPDGDLTEYGFSSIIRFADWDRQEAMICKRQKAAKKIPPRQQTVWLPGTVEVIRGGGTAPEQRWTPSPTPLEESFVFDEYFMGNIMSEVLPEIEDLDKPGLAEAVRLIDGGLRSLRLIARGDAAIALRSGAKTTPSVARIYLGLHDTFGATLVADGSVEVVFVSRTAAGEWIVTGFADEIDRRLRGGRPGIRVDNRDEPLAAMFAAHRKTLDASGAVAAAPADFERAAGALDEFLQAVG